MLDWKHFLRYDSSPIPSFHTRENQNPDRGRNSHGKLLSGLGLKSHSAICFLQWIPIANLNYPNSCPIAETANQWQKEYLILSVPSPVFKVPCHPIPIDMVPLPITSVYRRVNQSEVPTKNHRILKSDPGSELFEIWSFREIESHHLIIPDC